MSDITGAYYAEDLDFRETKLINPQLLSSGIILYEVLRINNGIALFLEDHIARLNESIRLSGFDYNLIVRDVHETIRNLSLKNNMLQGNVKIIIRFSTNNKPLRWVFFIPHHYPDPAMYTSGVRANFFKAARTNPNVKKLHPDLIRKVIAFIKTEGLYDVLLLDENETVTEGSRTNVFFVKKDTVYTAPGDTVLKGITRQKVLMLCNQLNIKLIEKTISINNLTDFDCAFFSGTSPKVLPIRQIAGIDYNVSNTILRKLMLSYDELIIAYEDREA